VSHLTKKEEWFRPTLSHFHAEFQRKDEHDACLYACRNSEMPCTNVDRGVQGPEEGEAAHSKHRGARGSEAADNCGTGDRHEYRGETVIGG